MKVLSLVLLAATTFSSMAHASYLERCSFKVNVLSTTPFSVEVLEATDRGSHLKKACKDYIGKTHEITKVVDLDLNKVEVGEELNLDYFFVSFMTPTGVGSSTTWTFVK
jgi:hypothetical protein